MHFISDQQEQLIHFLHLLVSDVTFRARSDGMLRLTIKLDGQMRSFNVSRNGASAIAIPPRYMVALEPAEVDMAFAQKFINAVRIKEAEIVNTAIRIDDHRQALVKQYGVSADVLDQVYDLLDEPELANVNQEVIDLLVKKILQWGDRIS